MGPHGAGAHWGAQEGPVGTHGVPWGPMEPPGTRGDPWITLGPHGASGEPPQPPRQGARREGCCLVWCKLVARPFRRDPLEKPRLPRGSCVAWHGVAVGAATPQADRATTIGGCVMIVHMLTGRRVALAFSSWNSNYKHVPPSLSTGKKRKTI